MPPGRMVVVVMGRTVVLVVARVVAVVARVVAVVAIVVAVVARVVAVVAIVVAVVARVVAVVARVVAVVAIVVAVVARVVAVVAVVAVVHGGMLWSSSPPWSWPPIVVLGMQPGSITTVGANWMAAPLAGAHVSVAPSSSRTWEGPSQLTFSPAIAVVLVTLAMSKSGSVMALDMALPVNVNDMRPAALTVAEPAKFPPVLKVTPVIRSVSAGLGRVNFTVRVFMAMPVAGVATCTCRVRAPPGVVPASGSWFVVKVGLSPTMLQVSGYGVTTSCASAPTE
jgi:hypothetical protein